MDGLIKLIIITLLRCTLPAIVVVECNHIIATQLNMSTVLTPALVNVVIARWRHSVRQTRTGMRRNAPVSVLVFQTV